MRSAGLNILVPEFRVLLHWNHKLGPAHAIGSCSRSSWSVLSPNLWTSSGFFDCRACGLLRGLTWRLGRLWPLRALLDPYNWPERSRICALARDIWQSCISDECKWNLLSQRSLGENAANDEVRTKMMWYWCGVRISTDGGVSLGRRVNAPNAVAVFVAVGRRGPRSSSRCPSAQSPSCLTSLPWATTVHDPRISSNADRHYRYCRCWTPCFGFWACIPKLRDAVWLSILLHSWHVLTLWSLSSVAIGIDVDASGLAFAGVLASVLADSREWGLLSAADMRGVIGE